MKIILKPILIADKEVAKLYQIDCIIEHMVTSNKHVNNDDVMIMIHKPPRKIRKLRNTSTVRATECPAISHSGTDSDLCDDQSLLGLSIDSNI